MFYRTGKALSAMAAAFALTIGWQRPMTRDVVEPMPSAPPAEAPPMPPRPALPSDEREAAAERRRVVAALVDEPTPPAPIRAYVRESREAARRRRQRARIEARKAGDAQA